MLVSGAALDEAAQTKVNEANSRDVRASLDQDILHLDVPVKDALILKLNCCIKQLFHDDLTNNKREMRDRRGGCFDISSWLLLSGLPPGLRSDANVEV